MQFVNMHFGCVKTCLQGWDSQWASKMPTKIGLSV